MNHNTQFTQTVCDPDFKNKHSSKFEIYWIRNNCGYTLIGSGYLLFLMFWKKENNDLRTIQLIKKCEKYCFCVVYG
jgi:hypothetical protein